MNPLHLRRYATRVIWCTCNALARHNSTSGIRLPEGLQFLWRPRSASPFKSIVPRLGSIRPSEASRHRRRISRNRNRTRSHSSLNQRRDPAIHLDNRQPKRSCVELGVKPGITGKASLDVVDLSVTAGARFLI